MATHAVHGGTCNSHALIVPYSRVLRILLGTQTLTGDSNHNISVGCCDLNCKLHIIEEAADAKVGVLGV